jgi:hypothetical protein
MGTCERCATGYDLDAQGAAPDAGLCPTCTANNDARVVL